MKAKVLQWIMIGFFAVGFVGLAVPYTFPIFVMLTPLAIVVALGMLIMGHQRPLDWRFFTSLAIVFALGYVVEILRVHALFDEEVFVFGDSFGPLLVDVPLLIGLFWLGVIYMCAAVAERLKTNAVVKVLAASGLVVLFDVAMELVAYKLDLWYWMWYVPIWNYLVWLVAAVVMFSVMKLFQVNIENRLALPMYMTLIVFMLLLSVVI